MMKTDRQRAPVALGRDVMANDLRRLRLLGTCAVLALGSALAAPAAAQDPGAPATAATNVAVTDAVDDEAIVVTGYRRSLSIAIDARRNADVIGDFVSSADIAGLPDVSIAESLARLPGVTSQRTGGQASAINIRGLSQDLVSSTLNGREQVSTSGNRTIEFDQYPSELIYQAAVYKSPKASQIEGGVAGKVELSTVRPLSNTDAFTAQINVRGLYNDRADENPDVSSKGYRVSASIQAKLLDDTLGVALGYARLYQPNVATRFVQFDFAGPGNNGSPLRDLNGNGVPERYNFGFEAIQFGGRETRDGVVGVIQYEPTPALRILIDGYYSKFDSEVKRRGYRVFNTQSGDNTLTNPVIVNNAITGGRFVNNIGSSGFGFGIDTELVNQDEGRKDELYTAAGNIAYDFSDKVTGNVDVAYSRGKSFFNNSGINIRPYATNAGGALVRASNVPGVISLDYQLNGLDLPTVRSISTNFTNAGGFRYDGLFIVPQEDIDELFAVAAGLTIGIDGSFLKSIEIGARYAARDAERTVTSFRTFGPDGGVLPLYSDLIKTAGFSGRFANAGFGNFIVADIDGFLDRSVGENRIADQAFGFTKDQSFTIREDVYSGYAQLNIDTEAGGLPFSGNIGVRGVYTKQGSTALGGPSANFERGDDYVDILPSANFKLGLTDQDVLRLSMSRQISRPRFFELRGSAGVGVAGNGGPPSGGGGNSELRPFRANQVDLAYEHYFGRSGAFTATAYYKDLRSYIIGGTIDNFDFTGFNFAPPPSPQPGSLIGRFDAPVNGSGGYVYGFEFNFTKTFVELPAPFDGLGVALNYAYAQSDLNFTSARSGLPVSLKLPGLSQHVANPTIFYEKNGFGTRVSARYRSSFVAPQIGLDEQIVTNAKETVVDAQVSYEFQEGSPLYGLKLLVQGVNITDEPTRSFFGQEAQTGTIQYFGRTLYAGVSFKF